MRRTYVRRRLIAASAAALSLWLSVPAAAGALGAGEAAAAGVRYVVRPGDTLWEIAVRAAPQEDPRDVVDAIRTMNGIGAGLAPGQELILPVFD